MSGIDWRFYINDQLIDEPIGWDAVELSLQRSSTYYGLDIIYGKDLTFTGIGAELIKEAFSINDIDAELNFLVTSTCDDWNTSSLFFDGIINCTFYKESESEVSILIESSGLQRDFKNNLSIPVSMDAFESLNGSTLTSIYPYDIGLHSKDLIKRTKLAGGYNYSDSYTIINPDNLFCILPFGEIQGDELDGANLALFPTITSDRQNTNPGYVFKAKEAVDLEISYDFVGSIRERFAADRSYYLAIHYRIGPPFEGPHPTLIDLGLKDLFGNTTMNQPINSQGTLNISLPEGGEFYIFIQFFHFFYSTSVVLNSTITVNFSKCDLTFKAVTKEKPSITKGIQLYEAFYKISEYITGVTDCFRSNFFGRLNSVIPYSQNGCGAWVALTNGLNIRNMLDKEGNKFPIVCSFEDLYNACNAIWPLGLKIERENGKEYIRIEPRSYFFNPQAIISLPNVSGITTSPNPEDYYNQFECGYSKTNLNTGGINGIDEFNSIRNYSIPKNKAQKKLSAVSDIATSGYLIEQTRRAQFSELPTTDFETDNDLFFICLNTSEVTSDLYTDPPEVTTYQAGEVSERDENFSSITNLISPETVYNLRISPVRMAKNWYPVIRGTIVNKTNPVLKFLSGTFNYQVESTLLYACNNSIGTDKEDQDLNDSVVEDSTPIYEPIIYEFEYPLSFPEFNSIANNSEKAIAFSCNGSNYQIGFIKSLSYQPNTEGGIASFKLIKGSCAVGSFDEGFDDGFNIGNC
ncbi:MAG: hypothetical protein J7604_03510 [Sporocytophaga sp.]|uniref:hypothetical protein n=1 Tax=Sporocytophaga sp. TaxID=2231183 RepID=UPI001B1D82EC|nr:hypothetical protein [Sporocytophaga sp.]MBO9699248.1 hypothetical protein [Sporocytophaga sp.]